MSGVRSSSTRPSGVVPLTRSVSGRPAVTPRHPPPSPPVPGGGGPESGRVARRGQGRNDNGRAGLKGTSSSFHAPSPNIRRVEGARPSP